MKKFNTYLLITVFLATATFFACKKDQPDMRQAEDPCKCASEVSAEFDILEQHNMATDLIAKTEYILHNKYGVFRAKEEDAEYTWYLGSEVLHEKEISRRFNEEWAGSTIPITLVVKKEPNNICFPNDNGYDSITKYMKVIHKCDTNILEGDFRVARVNTTDSFDIRLNFREVYAAPDVPSTSGLCRGLDIYNYDGNGKNCVGMDIVVYRIYRAFKFLVYHSTQGSKSLCDYIRFENCHLDLNSNEFSINYFFELGDNFGDNYVEYDLKGRKLS